MKAISSLQRTAWAMAAVIAFGAQSVLAEPLVYVPLGAQGRIVVVDAAKSAVVATIDDLPAVHGLAATADGRLLIAGSFATRAAGKEAPSKPAAVSAGDHAAHHGTVAGGDGNAGGEISTVSVVQVADSSVIRRIDVPGAVHHVAVSRDGRFAAVTHPNEGTVSVIDLGSFELVATVGTGPLPNYLAFSPGGDRLHVSNAGNDTVSEIDNSRWVVRSNVSVGRGPEHIVPSEDGSKLYVNNVDDGTVSVIAVQDRKVVKTVPAGTTLHGIDRSDDGGTLFVAARGEDRVFAIDLATWRRRGASSPPAPYHLAVVRGTGKLYVSSADEPKIWVIDQRDLEVVGEIPIGGKGHQMVQGVTR